MKKVFVCENCNNRIEDTSYCPYCGAKFIQEKTIEVQKEDNKNKLSYKCPNCNKKLKEESQYCPNCGKDLQKNHSTLYYVLYYVISIPILFIIFLMISMQCFSIFGDADPKCIKSQTIDIILFHIGLVIWLFYPIITTRKK